MRCVFTSLDYSSTMATREEGNVLFNDILNTFSLQEGRKCLFNDTLNTFYLRLYGVRHMVKYHTYSGGGNPLLPHGLLFPINSKVSFLYTIPDRIAHTTAFGTPVVEHWLDRGIGQWIHYGGSIRRPITPWVNALTTELHFLYSYIRHMVKGYSMRGNPQPLHGLFFQISSKGSFICTIPQTG